MATQSKKKKGSPHSLFWSLLKNVPGYDEKYKEVIKEGVVDEYSGGKTTSLSFMYSHYPAGYSLMIEGLKGDYFDKKARYDQERDKVAKRVIAVICCYVDKLGYTFPSKDDKIAYAKGIACRAANCAYFNKIPLSRMDSIYNLYCRKNDVDISGNPELDHPASKN
jgi:hypothetical protein